MPPHDPEYDIPMPQCAGFAQVMRVPATGSTNADLLDRPFGSTARAPSLLWADEQTAGRGRNGRAWHMRVGDGLTFSIALEHEADAHEAMRPAFSLVAGVVVLEALAAEPVFRGHDLRLKWPNDVVIGGRKAVGILIESRRSGGVVRQVVGIGINLRTPSFVDAPRPGAVSGLPPIGLLEPGRPWSDEDSRRLVGGVCSGLAQAHALFLVAGFEPWRERWCARDAFAGAWVALHDGAREIARGECRGVDVSGGLLLADPSGRARAHAIGELSARLAVVPAP